MARASARHGLVKTEAESSADVTTTLMLALAAEAVQFAYEFCPMIAPSHTTIEPRPSSAPPNIGTIREFACRGNSGWPHDASGVGTVLTWR